MSPLDVWLIALTLLVIVAAVAFGAYRAGWTAAAAYLSTAKQYGEVVNVVASNSNEYRASLDTTATTLAALKSAIEASTETLARGDKATEVALFAIFEGLERAGTIRSASRIVVGRQVGEPKPDDG